MVLPADLYVRSAAAAGAAEAVWLPQEFVRAAAALPGVAALQAQRVRPLPLDPARPAPVLIARAAGRPGARAAAGRRAAAGARRARLGLRQRGDGRAVRRARRAASSRCRCGAPARTTRLRARRLARLRAPAAARSRSTRADYRAPDRRHPRQRPGDHAGPGAEAPQLQAALRALAGDGIGTDGAELLEFARADEIRAISLRIFDRSFAVTYWLQAVAIAIGLVGIAASVSAQVLARRKEFGLLRAPRASRGAQVLAVVAGEGALWTAAGALLGLLLGIAVSVVLVARGQPAELSLDDGPAAAGAATRRCCAAAVALAGTLSARSPRATLRARTRCWR